MAATLQFDLVTPERRLASVAASEVQIPGVDGDMTAMEGHAPTITTLRPGVLRAMSAEGIKSYVVTGGFAEITATGVTVLAERAVPVAEITPALLDKLVADACADAAVSCTRDEVDKITADLSLMRTAVGQ